MTLFKIEREINLTKVTEKGTNDTSFSAVILCLKNPYLQMIIAYIDFKKIIWVGV